jgi:hypothetical protein
LNLKSDRSIRKTSGHLQQISSSEERFQTASRQADFFPDRLEQAETKRFHAMMLIDRGGPTERERAQPMLGQALETYTHIGMPRHLEMIQTLMG